MQADADRITLADRDGDISRHGRSDWSTVDESLDAGNEFQRTEWFSEEEIGAGLDSIEACTGGGVGIDDDKGRIRGAAYIFAMDPAF